MRRGVRIARASRERNDDRDAQPFGEADRLAERFVVLARRVAIRMDGIAVARQRADHETGIVDRAAKLVGAAGTREQCVGVEMIVAGPATRSELDGLEPERSHLRDHLDRRQFAEHRSEDA